MGTVNKNGYISCRNYAPVASISSGGAASGLDTTVTHLAAGPYNMEIRYEVGNTEIVPTRVVDGDSTNGWEIPCDDAADDGIEMGFGILSDASAAHVFTVGTDPAFFFEVKMSIPLVGSFDVCGMGFRGAVAYADAVNTAAAYLAAYDDLFGFNINNGDFLVYKSSSGSDAQDDVAVTDAVNDDVVTLWVGVDAAGAVSCKVDGTAVTLTNAATAFTAGDVLVPYMIFTKDAAAAGNPIIEHIKWGLQ